MQWDSRRGWAILTTQMAAALSSALVLTAINIVIYAIFRHVPPPAFLHLPPLLVAAYRDGGSATICRFFTILRFLTSFMDAFSRSLLWVSLTNLGVSSKIFKK